MNAAKILGPLKFGGERRNRNRRCIAAKNRIVAHLRFESRVELSFDVGVLDNRFDHQVGRGDLRIGRGRIHQRRKLHHALDVGRLRGLVVRNLFQDGLNALCKRFGHCVGHRDRQLTLYIGRGVSGAHDSGANHRHRLDLAGCDIAIDATVFFVSVGKKKDVDQRTVDRAGEQIGHAFGFGFARGINIERRGTEHRFKRRHRRGVVAFGQLRDHR